jgi:hypothetical protein
MHITLFLKQYQMLYCFVCTCDFMTKYIRIKQGILYLAFHSLLFQLFRRISNEGSRFTFYQLFFIFNTTIQKTLRFYNITFLQLWILFSPIILNKSLIEIFCKRESLETVLFLTIIVKLSNMHFYFPMVSLWNEF